MFFRRWLSVKSISLFLLAFFLPFLFISFLAIFLADEFFLLEASNSEINLRLQKLEKTIEKLGSNYINQEKCSCKNQQKNEDESLEEKFSGNFKNK